MSTTTRTPWTTLASAAVVLPHNDVDTDQIIPARFLTTTARAGLGALAFYDWRYDEHGAPRPDFVLNGVAAAGRQLLVAGENFGCGSSREHAPWALLDAGFRAVIAASFADIFRSNANRNGLLTVALGAQLSTLTDALTRAPDLTVTVDLEAQIVHWTDGPALSFPVDAFTKHGLLTGLDELGMLVAELPQILAWEADTGRTERVA
ncbi:MAG: 3-isopropylmalate dehydratase small subunit [Gemmatimonadaceae bacterium]|nr:3-isopropylmalate dehydratase small subunit [Gemmatimonadaceae bacterium]